VDTGLISTGKVALTKVDLPSRIHCRMKRSCAATTLLCLPSPYCQDGKVSDLTLSSGCPIYWKGELRTRGPISQPLTLGRRLSSQRIARIVVSGSSTLLPSRLLELDGPLHFCKPEPSQIFGLSATDSSGKVHSRAGLTEIELGVKIHPFLEV